MDVREFNETIHVAHNKHFENSEYGLVDPKESPNGNIIYHLYSDGEITSQKGGWAYLQRSQFADWSNPTIRGYDKVPFNFPKKANSDYTYAVLTYDECVYYRKNMIDLIEKYK